jgi:hypothetical protein
MIDSAARLHNLAAAESVVSSSNRSQASKSQSFAAVLSDRLASTTKNASEAADLPASLPADQQISTWRDPGGRNTSTPSSSTSTSSTTSQPLGLNGLVITYPTTTTPPAETAPAANPNESAFDQAYWASQPPAVQQLQTIQNTSERTQVATELAQQGYSIDVPIMAWGWDPQITTQLRQADGYTWVPSAEQQPVEVAPGLTFNGQSYNPASPPAGSIAV